MSVTDDTTTPAQEEAMLRLDLLKLRWMLDKPSQGTIIVSTYTAKWAVGVLDRVMGAEK